MTPFILHHPIVSLLLVAFLSALIALFVGGVLKSASEADKQNENFGMAAGDMVSTSNAGRELRVEETRLRPVRETASQPIEYPNACDAPDNSGVASVTPQPPRSNATAGARANLMQGGAASKDRSARVAHNHEVAGSNPAPATNSPVAIQVVAQPANGGSEIPPATFIEPQDLIERCAWCDFEKAVKSQPNYSHGICQRHKEQMLQQAKLLNQGIK